MEWRAMKTGFVKSEWKHKNIWAAYFSHRAGIILVSIRKKKTNTKMEWRVVLSRTHNNIG